MLKYVFALWLMALPVMAEEVSVHPLLQELEAMRDNIQAIEVKVQLTTGEVEDGLWEMTPVQEQVFISKLAYPVAEGATSPYDAIYRKLKPSLPEYRGLQIHFVTYDGKELPNILIYNGRVAGADGATLKRDVGRELELWTFGTARLLKNRLLATQGIPVFTFEQCRLLGNLIIDTTPRQCLLPDNNLLLDMPNMPTEEELAIKDFDTCLEKGRAIIDVFPRRCLAPGGRVFTEPPRLFNTANGLENDGAPQVDIDSFLQEYRSQKEAETGDDLAAEGTE